MFSARLGSAALAVLFLGAATPETKVRVRASLPHDPAAFTQGLLLYRGRLFETTGLYGHSTLREVDPQTGEVIRKVEVAAGTFLEGLARVPSIRGGAGEHLIALTWRERQALVYDLETCERVASFAYPGEGWGLCFDGQRLVMSDGTDRLTFRDAKTFEVIGQVRVTLDGRSLERLNELECVGGAVVANVWPTSRIVRIDPASGGVTAVFDASRLLTRDQARGVDVLNGIAHLGANRYLITGKRWPRMFEVELGAGVGTEP